ncbi:hypothetical protein KVR01_013334 [Diaporthe batatas]|uniref:uncharacterized protein n=1 Tax=Diaporthe batatas TaxID=748121 RepID=UPI001D05A001|nr:uncharacterized protein KVR01_013334 [Diaporthe batatas]KAG8156729.1 hypothetical protein KVR01_013334 [Diaporthe batatas]
MSSTKPTLESVRTANASLVSKRSLVAVFPGGTSGIGEFTVRALARHAAKGQGARIYLVGRNQKAADAIAADYAAHKNVQICFVKADDLSLLKDVDRCCEEIKQLEAQESKDEFPHVDVLVMSHADLYFGGKRRETSEGLDKSFSLLYYSRIRFITQLLPLLEASPLPSARVVSVYSAGLETATKDRYLEDLSLRNAENYSFGAVRNHTTHLKTMAFETIAEQHPKVGLVHVYPSLVITPGFDNNPLPPLIKIGWKLAAPAAKLFSVKPDEIGERVLGFTSARFGGKQETETLQTGVAESTNGEVGGGAYSLKYTGEVNEIGPIYEKLRSSGFREKAWEHTIGAFMATEKGMVFKD